MNGYISQQGRVAGVPTPINDAIVQVVSEIDAGTRTPGPENVELVLELAAMR